MSSEKLSILYHINTGQWKLSHIHTHVHTGRMDLASSAAHGWLHICCRSGISNGRIMCVCVYSCCWDSEGLHLCVYKWYGNGGLWYCSPFLTSACGVMKIMHFLRGQGSKHEAITGHWGHYMRKVLGPLRSPIMAIFIGYYYENVVRDFLLLFKQPWSRADVQKGLHNPYSKDSRVWKSMCLWKGCMLWCMWYWSSVAALTAAY